MADNSLDTTLNFLGNPDAAISAIDAVITKLKEAAAVTASLFTPKGGGTNPIKPLADALGAMPAIADKTEKSLLSLAQATARLEVAQGKSGQAAQTLRNALSAVDTGTVQAINAQRQLVTVQAQAANAAGKAETSMLREAQAIARLQQIAGNTPAAIKTLGDALEKATNKSSLPALRAELQKTYLDTNYANSPLIGAIDRISRGLGFLRPVLGNTAAGLQTVTNLAGQTANAFVNTGKAAEANAKSANSFLDRIRQANQAIVDFGKDQGGSASATDFFLTLSKAAAAAGDKIRAAMAGVRDSLANAFGRKPIELPSINLGNASKEVSQLAGVLPDLSSGASGATTALTGMSGSTVAMTAAVGAAIIAVAALVVGIGLLTAGTIAAARGLQSIGEAGIQTNAQLESLKIGLTAVIASVAEIRDSGGVQLKGIDAINASLPVAADQLRKLRIDALETTATVADLAPAFQAAIAPGLRAGLNIDQIRENTIKLTQAVAAVGLPLDQIKQETRAILSGEINRNTQAAQALDIRRKDVLEAQKQGRFAEFLEQKLSAAAAAGKLVSQTFAAAVSNLKEAGDTFQAVVTEGLFDQLRDKANAILPQIFDKNATNLISKQFEGIGETFTRIFDTAGATISRVIDFIFNGLKSISAFLDTNQETVGVIIESVNQIVVILGQTVASVGEIVLGAAGGSAEFRSMADVLKAIAFVVGLIGDGIKIVTSAAFTLGGVIRVAILAPLELAVTILARLLDFVPGAGAALEGFSRGLTNARQAATAGLTESAKAFGSAVVNVGKTSSAAIAQIEEARKRAAAGQRAVPGVDRKTPAATGATFKPPKRAPEDEDGKKADAAARKQAATELKLQQLIEKQAELSNKRIAAGLQASLQDRLISLETFTDLAIENDRDLLEKRLASLDIEQKAAERSVKAEAEREAKRAEFSLKRAQLQQEFDLSAEEKRDNLRRTIEKAEDDHQKRLLDIRDIGRRAIEAAIQDQQRTGELTATQATNKELELERQRFAEREALLRRDLEATRENATERQRVQDELDRLAAERAGFEEEASRRVRAALREELGELRAYVSERRDLQDDLRASANDALQRNADALARLAQIRPAAIQAAIQAQLKAELAAAETQHELALRQIDEQNSIAQNLAQTSAEFLEIERLSNEQRLAEQERFEAARRAIREKARQDALLADPSSPLSIFGQQAQAAADQGAGAFGQAAASIGESISKVNASLGNMQSIFQGAFGSIANGLGSMIEAFILTGKVGPQAFRKLAAGVIASVVAQAAVKAIFEVAEGFAALARFDPVSAASHFAAAKTYGIVAGVAALAGAALGATAGGGGSKEGQFVQEGQFDQSGRTVEQGGALPGREPIVIQIRARTEEGVILEKFDEDYRNNGRTRARIRADVLNEQ